MTLEKIHDQITTNFLQPLGIKDICSFYNISETKLTQGFKAKYDITVYGYYLERKMQFARTELGKGAEVSTVAELLNYSSTASFIRAFRKVYPRPPGSYRYRV